jgi:hypothetical protein
MESNSPSVGSSSKKQNQGPLSQAGELAGDTLEQVKETGTSLANSAAATAKEIAGRQVSSGGELVGFLARSVGRAADDLDRDAPEIADIVRYAAKGMEGLAEDLQHKSVDELVESASSFARRRPAVVFGMTAILGYLAFRAATSDRLSGSPASGSSFRGRSGSRAG